MLFRVFVTCVASVLPIAGFAQLLAGPEFRVNTYTTSFQFAPQVASDAAGNFVVAWTSYVQDGSQSGVFVVVWTSYAQDGDSYGIVGQRFDAAGSPLGGEFPVNTYTARLREAVRQIALTEPHGRSWDHPLARTRLTASAAGHSLPP